MHAGFIATAIREQNSLVFVGPLGDGRGVARLFGRGLLIGAGNFSSLCLISRKALTLAGGGFWIG
jgi:hypothetical protein